jgi:uncharacterized RDD family membrane protein YckC
MNNAIVASRYERIMASLIDVCVFLPLFLLDQTIRAIIEKQWMLFFYFLVSWQLGWLYNALLHGYRGQTLGKMHKKIQVVRASDGGTINYRRALVRESPYIVLVLINTGICIMAQVAWYGGWYTEEHFSLASKAYLIIACASFLWVVVEWVTMSLHPQRRAIHDLIAGTMVVRKQIIISEDRRPL